MGHFERSGTIARQYYKYLDRLRVRAQLRVKSEVSAETHDGVFGSWKVQSAIEHRISYKFPAKTHDGGWVVS